ncbi:MAG: VOC family protein [Actinomycetota bacterium]
MAARNFEITFDAKDSQSLAAFWMEALGYEPVGPPVRTVACALVGA